MDEGVSHDRGRSPHRRGYREAVEMTVEQLSDAAGLSVTEILAHEGGAPLSAAQLRQLSEILCVAPGDLLDPLDYREDRPTDSMRAYDYVSEITDPRLRRAALTMLASLAAAP